MGKVFFKFFPHRVYLRCVMKVFVINLERSSERRASIKRQLQAQDVDFEIIQAVDGATLTEEYLQTALNH
jgi:GR25 family glycosyltransferase involved in LPS biosynthesis